MLTYRRTFRPSRTVGQYAVGVRNQDGSTYGFVRMRARDNVGKTGVKGILGHFEADSSGAFFDSDNLFFYGGVKDLASNYAGRIPGNLLGDLEFVDKSIPYTYQGQPIDVVREVVWSLPLRMLQLRQSQRDLAMFAAERTAQRIAEIVNKLERNDVDMENPRFRARFKTAMRDFPHELAEHTLEQGHYLTFHMEREGGVEVVTLEIRILSSGVDASPPWVRDYTVHPQRLRATN